MSKIFGYLIGFSMVWFIGAHVVIPQIVNIITFLPFCEDKYAPIDRFLKITWFIILVIIVIVGFISKKL